MGAYAAALFCNEHGCPRCCLKAVSDNLYGNLKDRRALLEEIRKQFTSLLGQI